MSVDVRLLGAFEVTVDGVRIPPSAWTRRHAAAVVKLLALSDGRRLLRDQVVDALWPGISTTAAGPRLHKAAHFARRALGDRPDALLLRNDVVALLPTDEVRVDAVDFRRLAERALADGSPAAVAAAIQAYGGPLLPDDLYEPWSEEPREALRVLHHDLLARAGRWQELLREEPADEGAHLALIRELSDRGDVRGALRQFERLDQALGRLLGTRPSAEAEALRARLRARTPTVPRPRGAERTTLFGRKEVGGHIRARLERAASGRGGTVLVTGPPGVGKSAILDLALSAAGRREWRTGRGAVSIVEGSWPYAPVLEALNDLCRQHPALLDGLDDTFRLEIEYAMSGRDLTWSGESGHQRLFVAVAELARLAAAGRGLLLVVDDVHDADEASMRLIHYLARVAVSEPILLVLAMRDGVAEPVRTLTDSLVGTASGSRIGLTPLGAETTRRLLAERFPALPPEQVDRIHSLSGGLPFAILELAGRPGADGPAGWVPPLAADVCRTFQRLAVLGTSFSTDELLAVSGVDEEESYRQLELGLSGLVVEPVGSGYRFRHPLVRGALLERLTPYQIVAAQRRVAEALAALDAPPGRVAHHLLAAGLPERAVPYAIRAVETAGALGAYRDGLELIEGVRRHAGPAELPKLLARRGDLLLALGDPEAVPAYREAIHATSGVEHRLVRARLARVATFAGDFATASAALEGLEDEGDAADASLMMARAYYAYFSGNVEEAGSIAARAHGLFLDDPGHLVDLVTMRGMIAHLRGEWFEQFRHELRRSRGQDQLATVLFDAHLCVAEYLLYGRMPYAEVIRDAAQLRRRSERAGALRGVAFATALLGEAHLMAGDLERAELELTESVELHRDIDAPAGEAHSLQRLAEVRLAQDDREAAEALLERAIPLARWSVVSMHLLHRIYGTMINAAADPEAARAVVDRAEATLGERDRCFMCAVMLAVPAAIACADVGDVAAARAHLEVAADSARRWEGSAWAGAVLEARAHLARAEGDPEGSARLAGRAARLFRAAGHGADAARCDTFAGAVVVGSAG